MSSDVVGRRYALEPGTVLHGRQTGAQQIAPANADDRSSPGRTRWPRRGCARALDQNRTFMTSHFTPCWSWWIGVLVFGALALISFAAAFFFFISDDFVIRGQDVPASDARFVPWRAGLSSAGLLSVVLAWLCYRQRPAAVKL